MSYCAHTTSYTFPAGTKIVSFRTFKRKLVVVLSTGHVIQCRGDFDHQKLEFPELYQFTKAVDITGVNRLVYGDLELEAVEFVTDKGVLTATFIEDVEWDYCNVPTQCSLVTSAIGLTVIALGDNTELPMEDIQHEDDVLCNELLTSLLELNRKNCLS